MAHEFTSKAADGLQGVWYKRNGRRYCTWHFDPGTATLRVRRGAVTRATQLPATSLSIDELTEELPRRALALVNDGSEPSKPH